MIGSAMVLIYFLRNDLGLTAITSAIPVSAFASNLLRPVAAYQTVSANLGNTNRIIDFDAGQRVKRHLFRANVLNRDLESVAKRHSPQPERAPPE
jgi:hypothetical protein